MTDVLFALVLLLLAGCVVLLFAMFGELAGRISALGLDEGRSVVRPLEEARIGSSPDYWPEPLASLVNEAEGSALLLVLSTACGSCETVARQLVAEADDESTDLTGIVLSCGNRLTGEDFVRRHGLEHLDTYIDEGGEWVIASFGVGISPAALVIRDGRLHEAKVFTDTAALRAAVSDKKEVMV